jgi:microcystin-dependent protein
MSTPYLSEIRIFSFNFAPKGWATCNGQILAINQNQAIFALIGTYYGGNGQQNFALPNLQGRMAVHQGSGYVMGQTGGVAEVALTTPQLPAHSHSVTGVSNTANISSPSGQIWAASLDEPYGVSQNVAMNAASVASTGSGDVHSNIAPCLTLNFCIALQGIFPSQN